MTTSIGLRPKFKKNIPLSKIKILKEYSTYAPVDKDSAMHFFSVIKMNSTYLDVVNNFYTHKGLNNAVIIYFSLFMFVLFVMIPLYALVTTQTFDIFAVFILFLAMFTIFFGPIFLLYYKTDNNTFTHFPIRFNRKNKKVYFLDVFGEFQQADWKK